jgi:hypothetical protein
MPDHASFLQFARKQDLDRHVQTLVGVVQGIVADGVVGATEVSALRAWVDALGPADRRGSLGPLAETVERVVADGVVDAEEVKDLNWALEQWTRPNRYQDVVRADVQRLQGMLAGLLADARLTDDEIHALDRWLREREHLRGAWPYDEVRAFVRHVLRDKVVTDEERELLRNVFAHAAAGDALETVTVTGVDLASLTLPGICAVNPEVEFPERTFCFTGASARRKRSEMRRIVEDLGGRTHAGVVPSLHYLVVGAEGSPCWAFAGYGRKIEETMTLRRAGQARTLIVHENDFWDAVDDLT